ncbi:MAG: CHRD domain-containing protein [Novosphingobium sp.]
MLRYSLLSAGCALAASMALPAAALAAPVKLTATLAGANEPAGGDPDGRGSFSAEVDATTGDFCYSLSGTGITKPTAAHVHSGAAGTDGPPVIAIEVAPDMCQAVEPAALKPILAAPGNYYVNIHTADFPKGALRGQLQVAP